MRYPGVRLAWGTGSRPYPGERTEPGRQLIAGLASSGPPVWMSTKDDATRIGDAEFVSFLTRRVRESPSTFRRGTAFVGRLFSVKQQRRSCAIDACYARKEHTRGSPEWRKALKDVRRARKQTRAPATAALFCLRRAEAWVRFQEDVLDRDAAEAVCLIVVCIYDDNPRPNPALPPQFRAILWGGLQLDAAELILPGRYWRAQDIGFDERLMERARIAWARVESWGEELPQSSGSRRQALHEGHHLALRALAEITRMESWTKGATQRVQYEALLRAHRRNELSTYAGIKPPRQSSFWRYIREARSEARQRGETAGD